MDDVLVYIPDLPLDIPEDDAKELIQTRIEKTLRLSVKDIKCYGQLGVAIIQMASEDDKSRLVSDVQSLVLDMKRSIIISFVNELELDSYIVLDRKLPNIPSADDVARRYAQAYKTSKIRDCESVSVQFPNIFRIFFKRLDELIQATNTPDFKCDTVFATVYPRADCSFFEDLSPQINDKKVLSAIAAQIGENDLSPTSSYVQCNKQAGNAIVLVSKSIKKWTTEGYLKIDERNISKKAKLAYRALVSPVPRGFDVNRILRHKLFAGRVVSHQHIDDKFIIEFKDFEHYSECISIGGFGLDGYTMAIKEHAMVTDPDISELDAFNWYETTMFDIKPDILTIINNHQHPIFRYKWNAEKWIEQMKKAEADGNSKRYDLARHLLRVTVMLNTIGTLRKKRYVIDNKEVILKLERMRTIGYNHDSKLLQEQKMSELELKTPYPSTTIKVVNEDCLVLYEHLVSKGYQPLLLNMANATSPGGGYRKGDGAQEENIFRRSDYYHSLDGEIADRDRSERLCCNSKYAIKPLKGFGDFYPMEEFGAIYTSGITVFRGTEAKGYPYMENPLYNVCSIAMAAYRNPPLNSKNMLENKYAMNTRKKIENIFAIGCHHKHDCLVLSALGCGAFKNPPKHVALLFKSVIYQYAGYFDKIYFAIIDDHNTGNQINPHGNFAPFKETLDGLVVHPPKSLRVDGMSGPYRILNKTSKDQLTLSDVCVLHLLPCQHGTNCRDVKKTDHINQYSHPPKCSLQKATSPCDQMDDEVHMFTFMHTKKCKDGGECSIQDPAHFSEYDHPNFCKNQSDCNDIRPEHLLAYRHLPVCRDGIDCRRYLKHEEDHVKAFRHCRSVCPDDNCCNKFHDRTHMQKTIHSFRSPCPFTPYNCSKYVEYVQNDKSKRPSREVEQHCLVYSHVCLYGRQCTIIDDKHYEITIHIARQLCRDGDKCSELTKENHLESFTHPNIRDIRLFCRDPGFKCQQRFESRHLKLYRHGQNYDHLTVAPSSNLNSHINFVENQRRLIRTVNSYIDGANWTKAKISSEILNWIRALQPVHRCAPHIFESILVHGHVMSRHYMTLLERPKCVASAVLQHKEVRAIILKHNNRGVKENAFKLITALVIAEFAKAGADGIMTLDPDHGEKVNRAKMRLRASLNDDDLKTINDWTMKIAQASIALHGAPMGIGFDVDQKLGTDKHVFSIIGPHLGVYYGDIVIIFKQEIMFHPDTNFSVQAGTSFYSGRTYQQRPWVTDPGTKEKQIEDFHSAKLHCSIPRYEDAIATELVALTGKNKSSMDVNLNDVIHRWKNVDSHFVFEGHLAQLIPLDYVDRVYMPKNVFELLSPEAQQSAKKMFKNSLILTDHPVDVNVIKTGAQITLDATRKPYLNYILDQIDEKIKERMNTPRLSRGIVITVPGSNFDEHIVLPMTISQSYNLYQLDNGKAPNTPEYTYIYWQAMHGDMMLTIATDKIDPSNEQPDLRCLVCYVAEKPSTITDDYQESYSYLNDGHPFKHDTNVPARKFRAKSNVFYRGCNTDDFFTFCLKISHKTDEVTLSHAGPNGIYNHEKIYYEFDKSDLDLSKLQYIHVSGGNQDVPIRNLTINHERVSELHPSYDKEFKINTSGLQGKCQPPAEHIVRNSHHENIPSHDKRGAPEPYKPRPVSVPPVSRVPPVPVAPAEEVGLLRRIKRAIFGTSTKGNQPGSKLPSGQPEYPSSNIETATYDGFRDESPPRNRSKDETSSHNQKKDESSPHSRRRDEWSPRNRRREDSSPRNRRRDESSPRNRRRDESSPRSRRRDEASPRNQRRDESPSRNRRRDDSSPRNQRRDEASPHNREKNESARPHRSRAKSPPKSPPLRVSKLPPCSDSIYCLNQNDKDHIAQYSHPCRFNELCKRQVDEPHLNHQRHNVPKCRDDRNCSEKTNPIHRAKYRHTGLPDYLIPCRYQSNCYDKTPEHRLRFFHGEELPLIKKNKP